MPWEEGRGRTFFSLDYLNLHMDGMSACCPSALSYLPSTLDSERGESSCAPQGVMTLTCMLSLRMRAQSARGM